MKKKGLHEAVGLPADLAASLGRMIARHSLLENKLATCLYRAARVGAKIGRVAFANPRGSDILERIREVSQVTNLEHWMSKFPWGAFKKTLDDLKTRRDLIAHGVWLRDADTKKYSVIVTGGKWPAATPNARGMSRRIYPELRLVTPSDLRTLRSDIDKAIEEALTLDRLIQIAVQVHEHASSKKRS
jgi:hypothetical protein